MQGARGAATFFWGNVTYDEETNVIGEVACKQGLNLPPDNPADASLLADCRCVINRYACHKSGCLETAIGPKPVGCEIPEEDDTDGKELGYVITSDKANIVTEIGHPVGFPQVVE